MQSIRSFISRDALQAHRLYGACPSPKLSNSKWQGVVGLEIHAQIDSRSKLFSGSGTSYSASTNTQVSLFDCATPGTLPVLNRRCVEAAVLTGMALNCTINTVSFFDRKHYFYADLPTGYQITQRFHPIASNGWMDYTVLDHTKDKVLKPFRIGIEQVQLEQDSGKSLHNEEAGYTLIDLNRAGVGLMEIITRPEIHDGEQAAAFVRELVLILRTLRVCDVKLFEGSLRVDANISVHRQGEPLGTRTEVKNLASLKLISRAVDFEVERQISALERGEEIRNETLGFDFKTGETYRMRDKEVVQDYRYMPEPNLPPLRLFDSKTGDEVPSGQVDICQIRRSLPELPVDKRKRFIEELEILPVQAAILFGEDGLSELFEETLQRTKCSSAVSIASILINVILGIFNEYKMTALSSSLNAEQLARLIDLVNNERLPRIMLLKVVDVICRDGLSTMDVDELIAKNNWYQINDFDELEKLCDEIITKNPERSAAYKKGKVKVVNKMVDEVKIITEERANLKRVKQIMEGKLSGNEFLLHELRQKK